MRVGLVSDTHGLVRPELLDYLEGVGQILHAGDIGKPGVIDTLEELAPVTAIRGNVDRAEWAKKVPETSLVSIGGVDFYLVHSRDWLDLDPESAEIDVVLFGHSHKPHLSQDRNIWVNPGSCGRRRFDLPVSAGKMTIVGENLEIEVRELLTGELILSETLSLK